MKKITVLAFMLSGCAYTSVEVAYDDGGGKKVTASYVSTKDVAAPAFDLVRDEQGRVQRIQMSADGSLASPVNAQTADMLGKVTEGAVRGAVTAARPGPVSHDPTTLDGLNRYIQDVLGGSL